MFSRMPKILRRKEILDKAFSRARKVTKTIDKHDRVNSIRHFEQNKINTADSVVNDYLQKVLDKTPQISTLDPFYTNLVGLLIDLPQFKKSLAALKWAIGFNRSLEHKYRKRLGGSPLKSLSSIRKEFYGRLSSVLKQIDGDLHYLEECRRNLKRLPVLKDLPTVVLAGYPNVGKSSLLNSLTGAEPEIKSYPFTTKNILVGYIDEKIQVMDTPGLLDRPLDKKNPIEKQALLPLQYKADLILFLLDPTGSCGYSLELQKSLYNDIKTTFENTPVVLCMTKSDLFKGKELNGAIYLSSETRAGIDQLRRRLIRSVDWKTYKFKF